MIDESHSKLLCGKPTLRHQSIVMQACQNEIISLSQTAIKKALKNTNNFDLINDYCAFKMEFRICAVALIFTFC